MYLFKSYTNHQILWVTRKIQIKKPITHIFSVTTDPKKYRRQNTYHNIQDKKTIDMLYSVTYCNGLD